MFLSPGQPKSLDYQKQKEERGGSKIHTIRRISRTPSLDFFGARPVSHGNSPIFEWRKETKNWPGITRLPLLEKPIVPAMPHMV
jgi:hypothetical protein